MPFFIILNAASGHKEAGDTRSIISRVMREAGREHHLRLVENPQDLAEIARTTVAQANQVGGAVVVAGGDGTINTVANAVLPSACPLGILPSGTFNYFGRTHRIPEDTQEAVRMLLNASPQPVQVGLVNDHIFLVNASLGLYPKLLEDREAWKQQYGRSRMVAMWAALASVIGARRQLHLHLTRGGEVASWRTPTLFVANNKLQMEQIGMAEADALDKGFLVAIAPRPVGTGALLWLALRGALGTLGQAGDVRSFALREMEVRQSKRHSRSIKVAVDGEILRLHEPLRFKVSPQPLYLLKDTVSTGGAA
ncbi:diacylglycerol/lipid kinase family protein [Noviherbaspirillum suwonense]|nr:diacylglycerol kinase family protein [Noviherbaspirillum suwonense]